MAKISISGIAGKTKALGGKAVDLAAKGALYSQMFGNSDQKMSMGQRVGGAITKAILDETLGKMGTLGQAARAGLESRGKSKSPTGGSGVPGTTIGGTPIKTENVIQAISQSTQQILGGLNTLNATFRMGLNATANQMQAQASIFGEVKRDTEDMVFSLREIYEELNKQGYQDKNKNNLQPEVQSVDRSPVTSQNQDSSSILQNILTGALLSRLAPVLVSAIGGIVASVAAPLGLAIVGGIGAYIMGSKPASEAQKAQEKAADNIPTNMNKDVIITNPRAAGGAGIKKYSAPGQGTSGDSALSNSNTGTELTKAEIDEIFRIAPINASDDVLFEIAKQKFPGRKYNTLKQRIQLLRSLMQPQSSLSTGVQVASADMSSGDYLVSRQKMLENSRTGTSEQALRQQEQKLEEDAFKGVIPQLLNYESREMMYKADKIVFDAGKIEFLESMGMGGARGMAPAVPGAGADNFDRPGGTEARDSSGGTRVPALSSETKAAAEQLQAKGSLSTLPGQDPLAGYSDEQLKGLGVTRKEVRGAKGGREYSYDAEKVNAAALGTAREKAEKYLGRKMSDKEYDYLVRATHAEAGAGKKADPKEQAMIMASILNRARDKGEEGVITALEEENQFQSVTGTKYDRSPSQNFVQGPNAERLQSIEGSADMLGAIPFEQKNFTAANSAAYGPGTNIGYRDDMLKQGGTVIGGSVFQTNPNLSAAQSLTNALTNITPANAPSVATGPGGALPGDSATVIDAKSDIWSKVHPDLLKYKNEILGGAETGTGKISLGALQAADAVFRQAEAEGVKMKVAMGGGSNQHSQNHGAIVGGLGESLDIKPLDGWQPGQAERYAITAGKAGANRVGVPTNASGLHVQKSLPREKGGSGTPDMSWGYGPGADKYGRGSQFRQQWIQGDIRKPDVVPVAQQPTPQATQQKAALPVQQPKPAAAPPMPPAATPAMLDPTGGQASQRVAELSRKTTMNRESANRTGPVTQNIVNNNKPTADTTGIGFPDKNYPVLAMSDTLEKFTSHLFGMA